MSIGAKKDSNNLFDLLQALFIGIALALFGIFAALDRIYYSYMEGFIDLGKYHVIIGFVSIAIGGFYLYLAIKNLLKWIESKEGRH